MNQENNNEQLTDIASVNKSCDTPRLPKPWAVILMIVVVVFVIRLAWGQATPMLTITPMGTNGYSISFTNNIGTASFDVQGTPVLASPDYPWTWAAIGTPGQTNFLVNSPYPDGFYRVILDTNAIPLWEAADPNNPALGALSITIDSPANGSTLH